MSATHRDNPLNDMAKITKIFDMMIVLIYFE